MSGETKTCNTCGEDKPWSDFSPHREGKFGLYGHCKSCQNDKARIRRAEKPGYLPRPATEEERTARRNRSKRNTYLKRKFGITLDQYETMLFAQKSECAICGRHADQFKNGLVVDHDHRTGSVRMLLCQPCNAALGGFQEDPLIMSTAMDYLYYFEMKECLTDAVV